MKLEFIEGVEKALERPGFTFMPATNVEHGGNVVAQEGRITLLDNTIEYFRKTPLCEKSEELLNILLSMLHVLHEARKVWDFFMDGLEGSERMFDLGKFVELEAQEIPEVETVLHRIGNVEYNLDNEDEFNTLLDKLWELEETSFSEGWLTTNEGDDFEEDDLSDLGFGTVAQLLSTRKDAWANVRPRLQVIYQGYEELRTRGASLLEACKASSR